MRSIFCVGYEERGEVVADWYTSEQARDEWLGQSGASREVAFFFGVPECTTEDQITAIADDLAWLKYTYPGGVDVVELDDQQAQASGVVFH